MIAPPVIVIGAGPSGLAFAQRFGEGVLIFERSPGVGGLSRSIELQDGVFDIGGHSFHTPHAEVHDFIEQIMGENWHRQKRDARVWFEGELIPYPFQQNYELLTDAAIIAECRAFQANPERVQSSSNFEEWLRNRFGDGISKHFMLPYNRKLWGPRLDEMSCQWVHERVAGDRRGDTRQTGSGQPRRRPLESDSTVSYPLEGGFGAITRALAERCGPIQFEQPIVKIDPRGKMVTTAKGETWEFEQLVSTMPVVELLRIIEGCPVELIRESTRLQFLSLKVVLILAKLSTQDIPQRIYIADPEIPPHKVAFNHTSSPNLQKRERHAIMGEVSYSADKPVAEDDVLLEKTCRWLVESGYIASERDLADTRVIDVPYGYPVYCHHRGQIMGEIQSYLEAQGIHSIGRFGAWHYANSDECIRQGLVLARTLMERNP